MTTKLRLARPVTPPTLLRALTESGPYAHNSDLRIKYVSAVEWLRNRPGGSKWLLDAGSPAPKR